MNANVTPRRINKTGRSTGRMAGRRERRNRPPKGQSWIWLTREMIESPAWRSLSELALKCLFRLAIEHMSHGGTENGRLHVTFDQFADNGIRRRSVSRAIQELIRFGWINRTAAGGGKHAAGRKPAAYALTWLPIGEISATNDWKSISADGAAAITKDLVAMTRPKRNGPNGSRRSAGEGPSPPKI